MTEEPAVAYSFVGKKVQVVYGDKCLHGTADHIEGNLLVLMSHANEPTWINLKYIEIIYEEKPHVPGPGTW